MKQYKHTIFGMKESEGGPFVDVSYANPSASEYPSAYSMQKIIDSAERDIKRLDRKLKKAEEKVKSFSPLIDSFVELVKGLPQDERDAIVLMIYGEETESLRSATIHMAFDSITSIDLERFK